MSAPLDMWLDELVATADEFAEGSLGLEAGGELERTDRLPSGLTTACVALVGERTMIQLGVSVSEEEAGLVAAAMLGLEEGDDALTNEDVADALGEVANVFAGGLKIRMEGRAPQTAIGLPIVLHGRIDVPAGTETRVAVVRWGPVEAKLFLLRKGE
jgi:CheY-specific phosphatase CheX